MSVLSNHNPLELFSRYFEHNKVIIYYYFLFITYFTNPTKSP